MKDLLIKLVTILKPKYYNHLTLAVVTCGTALLTKPLWLELLNWLIKSFNSNYKNIELTLIGEHDSVIGFTLIVLSLIWHTTNRFIDLKQGNVQIPAYKESYETVFNNYVDFCQAIYPLLKDNKYIFETFGPNGGRAYTNELRLDFTMWNKYKREDILPNNKRIKEIIKTNINIMNREQETIARKMIAHIDAFEEHLNNPTFDYSDYQFPKEFESQVYETCFTSVSNSESFLKKKKWLEMKIINLGASQWFFFGSSIFTQNSAKDLDLAIYFIEHPNLAFKNKLDKVELEFELKFRTKLHLTVFHPSDILVYRNFSEAIIYKIKGHG